MQLYGLWVHNAMHCREHGCTTSLCGVVHEVLGSGDLDHHPITWRHPSVVPATQQHPRLRYNQEPDKWRHAVSTSGACVLQGMHYEIERCRPSHRLWELCKKSCKAVLDSIAALWRTVILLCGAAANLLHVGSSKGPQAHGVSAETARCFQKLCQAARSGGGDLVSCRRLWAQAKERDQQAKRDAVQQRILQICNGSVSGALFQ